MTSHHEIVDFVENIRAEMPARLHHVYEEAVDRALEQQHKRGKEFAKQIIKNSPMIRKEWERQQREEGILAIFVLVIGFLGGAAVMYLFDPDRGTRRRAAILGQVNHAAEQVLDDASHTVEQVRDEANKVVSNISDTVKNTADQASDTVNKVVGNASDDVKDAVGKADKAVDKASDMVKESATQVRDSASKAVSSASGAAKETAGQVNAAVSDATLAARVRVEIARAVHAPGAIEVTIKEGVVTLKGQVPAVEVKGLIEKVQATPGVKSVENRLEIHDAQKSGSNGVPH